VFTFMVPSQPFGSLTDLNIAHGMFELGLTIHYYPCSSKEAFLIPLVAWTSFPRHSTNVAELRVAQTSSIVSLPFH